MPDDSTHLHLPYIAANQAQKHVTHNEAIRLLDALVDVPFALPTAVAGLALTTLLAANGWFGAPLAQWGIKVAYAPAGIVCAMAFTSIPFVVRTVQPVLEDLEPELEEAAATLSLPVSGR